MYLANTENLYEKGLWEMSMRAARQGIKLASKSGLLESELQLQSWARKIVLQSLGASPLEKLGEIADRVKVLQGQLEIFQELEALSATQTIIARKTARIRTDVDRETIEGISSHRWVKTPPPTPHIISLIHHHYLNGVRAISTGEYVQGHEHFNQIMDHWHTHAHLVPLHPDLYISTLNNFLYCCLYGLLPEKINPTVEIVRKMKGLSQRNALHMKRIAFQHQMTFEMNFGTVASQAHFFKLIQQWVAKEAHQLPDFSILTFWYNLALYHFMQENYPVANQHLLSILHTQPTKARTDIQDFARIFQLILQFELGNLGLQEYLTRSAYRYFKRSQKLLDFERAIIRFMRDYGDMHSSEDQKAGFERLQSQLLAVKAVPSEPNPVGLETVQLWVQTKLADQSLATQFADRIRNNRKEAGFLPT